jgi:hypothetical protein
MNKIKFKRIWTGSFLGTCQNMRKHYEYHSEDGQYIVSQGKGCMDWDKPHWIARNTITGRVSKQFKYLADAKEFGAEYINARFS